MRSLLTFALFCALCSFGLPVGEIRADNCSRSIGSDCNDYDNRSYDNSTNATAGAAADANSNSNSQATGGTGVGIGVGGQGGQGGDGGSALALGVQGQQQGQFGINDLEADLSNRNRNANEQGQSQFGINANETNVDTTDINLVKGSEQSQYGLNLQGQSIQDSGNSESESSAFQLGINKQSGYNKQGQDQGQDQGQEQSQGQDQTSVGSVDSHDIFDASDHSSTVYEAAAIPVNTAAPVFAGSCSQGASGQWGNFGVSAGTGNPVCDFVAVAGARIAAGDREGADEALDAAMEEARFRAAFARLRSFLTLGIF